MSRAMKKSGIPWIGEVPEGWRIVRGKNIVSVLSGYPFDSNLFTLESHFKPLIRIRDILNNFSTTFYSGDYPEEALVQTGDILVGMDGDFNVAFWEGGEGLLNQRVCRLSVKQDVYSKYVYYVIQNPLRAKNDITYSTTVKHLSVGDIGELSIPLPSFIEQKVIADFLDEKCGEIDKMVSLQEKIVEELKAYKQSVITEVVCRGLNPDVSMKDSGIEWIGQIPEGWEILKTLWALDMPITDGPHTTPELFDTGIPFVSAEAVSCGNGGIDFSHIRGFISQEFYEECCLKYVPQRGDVYMIKSGATTGRVSIVDTDKVFTIWSPLAVFRANPKRILPRFLFYSLQGEYYQEQVRLGWTYGTQQNIGMRTLETLQIVLPTLSEQQAIVDYLDKQCKGIDTLISLKQSKIDALKEYKKSIIYEYITGKKEVNG